MVYSLYLRRYTSRFGGPTGVPRPIHVLQGGSTRVPAPLHVRSAGPTRVARRLHDRTALHAPVPLLVQVWNGLMKRSGIQYTALGRGGRRADTRPTHRA